MKVQKNNAASTDQALGNGATINSKAEQVLNGVTREVHNFLADIEDLIVEATSLTGDDLAQAKEKLSERVTAAKKSVEYLGRTVTQKARHSAAVTNEYVHEQPWTAIGLGAAAGLLLGYVLARK